MRLTRPLLALLCVALAREAPAQTKAPAFVYPPVVPTRPFEAFPETDFQPKPDVLPAPSSESTLKGGLTVRVYVPRNSRLGIGELIRIRYEFDRPANVQLDLAGIKQGVFGLERSDVQWRYPDHPERCVRITRHSYDLESTDGKRQTRSVDRVELELQHFIFTGLPNRPLPEEIEFSFRFRYAYETVAGGVYPDFIDDDTPKVKLSVVRSGDRSMTWRYAPSDRMPVRSSPLAPWLRAAGLAVLVGECMYVALSILTRVLYRLLGTRNPYQHAVALYRRLERETAATRTLTREQCNELAAALRAALAAPALTGAANIAAYFSMPQGRRKKPHTECDRIVEVLCLFDAVAADSSRTVTEDEWRSVFQSFPRILADR